MFSKTSKTALLAAMYAEKRGSTTTAHGHSLPGLTPAHRGADPERLGLVARGQHDPAADDHGPAAQAGDRHAARPTRRRRRDRRAGSSPASRRSRHEHMFAFSTTKASARPAKLPPCATDGCPSRSSHPSSSATTRSPTTSRRARWPTAASPTSGSPPGSARARARRAPALLRRPPRRSRPARGGRRGRRRAAGRRRVRHAGRGRGAVRDRDLARSSRATTQSSCARTTRPISRRRARSAPTLDVVDLSFDDAWRLDVERVAALVRPGTTRLISVTCPHNPTGHDARPRDRCTRSSSSPSARARCCSSTRRTATSRTAPRCRWRRRLSPRAISVSSMSKAYGLPGPARRLGRVPRPAARRDLARGEGADLHLRRDDRRGDRGPGADRTRPHPPADPRRRRRAPRDRARLDARPGRSSSGSSPRAASSASCASRADVAVDTARFYDVLLAEHGTYVGPGHWFEVDDRHFRLGFGWPTNAELAGRALGRCPRPRNRASRRVGTGAAEYTVARPAFTVGR